MDWKDVGESLVKMGLPILGAALPLPGGAAIGQALASMIGAASDKPSDILATLTASSDAVLKAKQFEETHQETLLRITTDAEIRAIEAVNKTMQAEAAADHWPTYSWRPYNGFVFGSTFFGVYFLLPLLKLPVPVVPTEAWIALGSVLGVASWFRGKAQANPSLPTDNRG